MKERQIAFRADMIPAILSDQKTQTRRPMKPQPVYIDKPTDCAGWFWRTPKKINGFEYVESWSDETSQGWMSRFVVPHCKYGKVGDRLVHVRKGKRVRLEITDIRVERLRDISEEDAFSEGVTPLSVTKKLAHPESFFKLWDSIYGNGASKKNPWVWVISFKRVEE